MQLHVHAAAAFVNSDQQLQRAEFVTVRMFKLPGSMQELTEFEHPFDIGEMQVIDAIACFTLKVSALIAILSCLANIY